MNIVDNLLFLALTNRYIALSLVHVLKSVDNYGVRQPYNSSSGDHRR